MKKLWISLLAIAGILSLVACSSGSTGGELNEIKIGATAGPYSDQLKESIKPILEKEGYTVTVVEFNDYIQPNNALNEGNLDANVFQTSVYLDEFNKELKTDLVAAHFVPTAPISVYSEKHNALSDLKEGMKVTLPNDPVNMARALQMMEQFGWIKLKEEIEQSRASEKDIIDNKFNLVVVPLEAAQLPRSLGDTDFAFINGNFAIASGLKLEEAIERENTPPQYMNNVVYRKEDLEKPFVAAIKKAYHSKEFLTYTNEHNAGFVKPDYQKDQEGKK